MVEFGDQKRLKLTASEGDDRVAACLPRAEIWHRAEGESAYSCEACGSCEYRVDCFSARTDTLIQRLPCMCPRTNGKFAVVRKQVSWKLSVETGILGEDREVVWDDSKCERIIHTRHSGGNDVTCDACYERCDGHEDFDWTHDERVKITPRDIWLSCLRCRHEIEFGFERDAEPGRIWPVESADFSPASCIPDPKYRLDWERRGWLVGAGEGPIRKAAGGEG